MLGKAIPTKPDRRPKQLSCNSCLETNNIIIWLTEQIVFRKTKQNKKKKQEMDVFPFQLKPSKIEVTKINPNLLSKYPANSKIYTLILLCMLYFLLIITYLIPPIIMFIIFFISTFILFFKPAKYLNFCLKLFHLSCYKLLKLLLRLTYGYFF